MDHTALKTALKRYGFDDNDPLTTWLNAALHDFEMAHDWQFMFENAIVPLIANAIDVSLDTPAPAIAKILSVTAFNSDISAIVSVLKPLPQLTKDDLQIERVGSNIAVGIPEFYTTAGGTGLDSRLSIIMDKKPDFVGNLLVNYKKSLTELSGPTDVPAIPKRYHYFLVYGAAAIGLETENEEDRATNARNNFLNGIDKAIADDDYVVGNFDTVQNVQEY